MSQQAPVNHQGQFLSLNAGERNMIVICGISLVLIWLLLGKIGLVLIGVVSGIQLRSLWEKYGHPRGSDESCLKKADRSRQLGIEVVHRLMTWQSLERPRTPAGTCEASVADFSDFQPAMGVALSAVSNEVVEQYVE